MASVEEPDHTGEHDLEEEEEEETVVGEGGAQAAAAKKKKKKKKKAKKLIGGPGGAEEDLENVIAALALEKMGGDPDFEYQAVPEDDDEKHAFWSTQPMRSFTDKVTSKSDIGAFEGEEKEIRPTPYPLPDEFEWLAVNVEDDAQMRDVYNLLVGNYVEDSECMFRFNYSIDFLKWALMPPGYNKDFHIAVSWKGKMVGFITGIPATVFVHGQKLKTVEINFLCVHKKLRSKRLAPVLIKEVTRRVNLTGVFQAVYTAGAVLPRPVASCRYWHRSLNPKKLIDVGFTSLGQRMTLPRTIKLYRLPDQPLIPGFRKMEPRDVPQCAQMLREYLTNFFLFPLLTDEEFRHWLLPKDEVVYSFVVSDPSGKITDFTSFYYLPSTIIGNKDHNLLRAAYSYYTVAKGHTLHDVTQDALIIAKNLGMDVFNALDLLDNGQVLKDLKFGSGDGNLQYYIYNWRCPDMPPNKVGLVLL